SPRRSEVLLSKCLQVFPQWSRRRSFRQLAMLRSSQLNLPKRLRQSLAPFPLLLLRFLWKRRSNFFRVSRLVPWRILSTVLSAAERDLSEFQHQFVQAHRLVPILQLLGSLCLLGETLFLVLSLVESLAVPFHR